MVEVPALNNAAWDVCDFYEELGHLQRLGVLRAESVWFSFGLIALSYWPLCNPAIEKSREERGIPALSEEFEDLSRLMAELDREQGIEPPHPRTAAPSDGRGSRHRPRARRHHDAVVRASAAAHLGRVW